MSNILFSKVATGFTIVPNKLLVATNVSLRAKALYGYLISKPNKWSFSTARICNEMKEGRDAINNVMNELQDLNLLSRRRIKKDGKWVGVAYSIASVDDADISHKIEKRRSEKIIKPLEERIEKFRADCLRIYNQKEGMTKRLGKKFFTYWTETNSRGIMKWELQETFSISMRMDKFIENQKIYDQERIEKKTNKREELTTKNT
jgi:predicted transcriptional regulator